MNLLFGDALLRLLELPDNSIDSIVTDPPYELGFMGRAWDSTGIAYNVDLWRECLRVLKPGGHLLAFGGSRTYHRLACAVEDAGFEIRDQIMWIYGQGFPKSKNLGDGWGTALKPAHEPIVMARKPFAGSATANFQQQGVGGLHIEACRVEGEAVPINKLAHWSGFGQEKRPDYEATVNDLGRWPANLIHDGSEEVIEAFPAAPGQLVAVKYNADERKTQGIYGVMKRGHKPSADNRYTNNGSTNFALKPGAQRLDSGSAARFFYCAKATKADREYGCDALPHQSAGTVTGDRVEGSAGLNSPRAGAGRTSGSRNFHPTVKPLALMQYLCRLVTPVHGVVLDPFTGSGSTGRAALLEGFDFIGIEKEQPYFEIAKARISATLRELQIPIVPDSPSPNPSLCATMNLEV
jgi:DNA modification methylase